MRYLNASPALDELLNSPLASTTCQRRSYPRTSPWDSSWFIVDRARLTVLVLCVTDVD
jgi:hypothetical protein